MPIENRHVCYFNRPNLGSFSIFQRKFSSPIFIWAVVWGPLLKAGVNLETSTATLQSRSAAAVNQRNEKVNRRAGAA